MSIIISQYQVWTLSSEKVNIILMVMFISDWELTSEKLAKMAARCFCLISFQVVLMSVGFELHLNKQGRIFDGHPETSVHLSELFSEPLYYDVRYDLPEDIIRNKRDSRFFPGNQPAGVMGITKELLNFIQEVVNPLGVEEQKHTKVFDNQENYYIDENDVSINIYNTFYNNDDMK